MTNDKQASAPLDDLAQIWATYDLGVATALMCLNYQLQSVDRGDNPKKALFIFHKGDGIEATANQYFTDQLEVRARSFFDHLKALKNQLYSE